MRRQGHYGSDSGGSGHAYGGAAPPQLHQQQQNIKSGYYQGRHQEQQPLGDKDGLNQWRWERDDGQPKLPQTAMSPTAPFTEAWDEGLNLIQFLSSNQLKI